MHPKSYRTPQQPAYQHPHAGSHAHPSAPPSGRRGVYGNAASGRFKIRNGGHRVFDDIDDLRNAGVVGYMPRRVSRILSSIRRDVDEGGVVRIRQILRSPRKLYRIELELPEMSYERTTIVDAETLEALIDETPEHLVRERFHFRS